ncbi:lamin tail domain-containing protein [Kytococcus schroeteri]|uniref:lamin tail domain-containing protein n=1 Tax=Kytococcus schroeteri TaxID=138300 RepID=UPI0035EC7E0B
MRPLTRTPLALTLALLLPAASLAGAATAPAHAVSEDLVISEAYGGGGNSGAPLRNDFVELFNRGDHAVDLTGWTLEYRSATGSSAQVTKLSGSVAPGARFLVQQAAGSNTSAAPLPTPDATGTVPMSSSGAKLQLVGPDGSVVDLLGWGGANAAEGLPAGATSNTTSVARTQPCHDTDSNAADFTTGAPTPENSTEAPVDCSAVPDPDPDPEPGDVTIAEIQGTAHRSPLEGQGVRGVPGVVTTTDRNGFWMQSTTPDEDDATSEGVYVYTRGKTRVAVGDAVLVDGLVAEYRPGGSGGHDNLTTTQLTNPTVTVTGTSEVPAPVVLGEDVQVPAQTVESGDPGSVEYAGVPFLPQVDAIDAYEALEGMRVGVRDAQAVGPTASFDEVPVVPADAGAQRSVFGGVVYGGYDQPNARRVQLAGDLLGSEGLPQVDTGARFDGLTAGVLDYSYANFKLKVTELGSVQASPFSRDVAAPNRKDALEVATFNVENLDPTDDAAKFDGLARQLVDHLGAPDIVALEEVQDDNGVQNDGTVDSSTTTDQLIAAIEAAGGPRYEARWVNPEDGQDGGQPGGNIRNVMLHRTDVDGLRFVHRPGGDATTATTVESRGRWAALSASPGRINPLSSAWENSRKPVVAEYSFQGRPVFVIGVHFSSKGGDDPIFGRWQQPVRSSETQRMEQAREVRGFVDSLLAKDAQANVIVAGDVNDFEFSPVADTLVGSGATALRDLPRELHPADRYTYTYQGNSQVLDHLLLSPGMTTAFQGKRPVTAYRHDVVHVNADFHDQLSDHDPQVVSVDRRALR